MTLNIKLYAWEPTGVGPQSYFVAAESKDLAIAAVTRFIEDDEYQDSDSTYNYDTDGWGGDSYRLSILDVGQVVDNGNA